MSPGFLNGTCLFITEDRAILPQIRLEGPKIVRPLTTGWYARRVNGRFEGCLRG